MQTLREEFMRRAQQQTQEQEHRRNQTPHFKPYRSPTLER
jgi:hypothetical protein